MKKSMTFKLFAFTLVALMVASCSKYEEGSNFSLISKKSRVANTWELSALTANDIDISSLSPVSQITATKEGAWTTTYTIAGISTDDAGTWAFNDDATTITVVDSNGTTTMTIIKLKKDEMKLSNVNSGITYVTELATK